MTASPARERRHAALEVQPTLIAAAMRVRSWLDEPIPYQLTEKAHAALAGDRLERCLACRLLVPVLVDDSGLCLTCDAVLYPSKLSCL